jgi:hypothetical protein
MPSKAVKLQVSKGGGIEQLRVLTHDRFENYAHRSLCDRPLVQMENDNTRSGIADVNHASSGSSLHSWRFIPRPLNLGLIGLAVAVALWGFAYKLSLYYPDQNHPAPIGVAKLWLGPEGTLLIAKNRPTCQLQQGRTLDSSLTQQVETFPEANDIMLAEPNAAAAGEKFSTACTPRSPPSHMS